MRRSTPRVSVVIPTHDNAHYLACALDSALAQRYRDFEVIVVDDASSDHTASVLAAYRDDRLRVVVNDRKRGIAGSRNRGIAAARGEYTAALDGDDWAHPARLAAQVAFLDAHPEHAVVGSWARWMARDGRSAPGLTRRPIRAADAAAQLIFKSSLQQPSVTGRTAVLREYAYDETFDLSSDYELWVRLAQRYRLASQPLALVTCRRHPTSTTRGASECVAARQRAIFACQLDLMGLNHEPDDLERHRLLWRANKQPRAVTDDELDWAEDWLDRLATANARSGVYERAAFAAVLGWGWLQVCTSAARRSPARALRRGAGSPLRRAALAGAWDQFARRVRPPQTTRRRRPSSSETGRRSDPQ